MSLTPWLTSADEGMLTETGEVLNFFTAHEFRFTTTPIVLNELNILYNYDVEVFDENTSEIEIKGESIPLGLTFVQLSNTTGRLFGSFEKVGTYFVSISATEEYFKIHQDFEIIVTQTMIDSNEVFTDLGTKFFIVYEEDDA